MKARRRLLTVFALAIATVPLVLAITGLGTAGAAGTPVVKAVDSRFVPSRTTISAGRSVRWTNVGKLVHNVTGPGFSSGSLKPGKSFTFRFGKAGTYKYKCTIHPATMRGTVTVAK